MTHRDVASYALASGLVPARAVVDGELTVLDRSSRHNAFLVQVGRDGGYVLKQGGDLEGHQAVRREAAVYRRLAELGGAAARYLPPFERFDEARGVLVLRLLAGWEDLRTFHHREEHFPTDVATALGRALGAIHRDTRRDEADPEPEASPLVLTLQRPGLALFRDASATTIALVKLIQQAPGFGDRLDDVRGDWRRSAVIHVDMKWENCLFRDRTDGNGADLRIIDWETAVLGDPSWDIGAALSQYLSAWLFSIPVTGDTPPDRFPELARFPLERMHAAMQACWSAYADEFGLGAEVRERECLRAVRYAAARLLQTALEAAQMSTELTGTLVLHLQLAANMLDRPDAAAHDLLKLTG